MIKSGTFLDKDESGFLNLEEWTAASELFYETIREHAEAVVKEEMKNVFAKHAPIMKKAVGRMASSGVSLLSNETETINHEQFAKELFLKADKNQAGKVSFEEFCLFIRCDAKGALEEREQELRNAIAANYLEHNGHLEITTKKHGITKTVQVDVGGIALDEIIKNEVHEETGNMVIMESRKKGTSERVLLTDKVKPESGELHVMFRMNSKEQVGGDSKIVWTAVDCPEIGEPNLELASFDVPIGLFDQFQGSIVLSEESLWPVGDYRVSLVLNGELCQSHEFTCIPDLFPAMFEPVFEINSKEVQASVFSTKDTRKLSCCFLSSIVVYVADKATFKWMNLDSKREIARMDIPRGKYTEFKSAVTREAWFEGQFEVSLSIDGNVVRMVQFQMK